MLTLHKILTATCGLILASGQPAASADTYNSILWSRAIPAGSVTLGSLPAITNDGSAYVGSSNGTIAALNPNGEEKWKVDLHRAVQGDVAIDENETIYFTAGGLFAFTSDGSLKWKLASRLQNATSPCLTSEGLIVFAHDGELCAVKKDGVIAWQRPAAGLSSFSPVIGPDGTIYCGGRDGSSSRLQAFESDGSAKWELKTSARVSASPAVDETNTLYFGGVSGGVYAISADGKLKWSFDTEGQPVWSTPALDRKQIYFGCGNFLYSITIDAKFLWKIDTRAPVPSSPAIDAEGMIYFGSNDGTFYRVSAQGLVTDKSNVGSGVCASAVISKSGKIYIRDLQRLTVLHGSGSGPSTVWPMRRHDQYGTARCQDHMARQGQ